MAMTLALRLAVCHALTGERGDVFEVHAGRSVIYSRVKPPKVKKFVLSYRVLHT